MLPVLVLISSSAITSPAAIKYQIKTGIRCPPVGDAKPLVYTTVQEILVYMNYRDTLTSS